MTHYVIYHPIVESGDILKKFRSGAKVKVLADRRSLVEVAGSKRHFQRYGGRRDVNSLAAGRDGSHFRAAGCDLLVGDRPGGERHSCELVCFRKR